MTNLPRSEDQRMRRATTFPLPDEVSLPEATIIARCSAARMVRLIATGAVRGRYDDSRPVQLGRWFASRADCERIGRAAELSPRPAE